METEPVSAAAHERAVMMVRFTLLLLVIGVALFIFTGYGGTRGEGQRLEHPAERLKQPRSDDSGRALLIFGGLSRG